MPWPDLDNPFVRRPSILGSFGRGFFMLIVIASVLVQLGLIWFIVTQYLHASGERQGWAGMGLIGLLLYSLFIIVPGTLISLVLTCSAIWRLVGDLDTRSPLIPAV